MTSPKETSEMQLKKFVGPSAVLGGLASLCTLGAVSLPSAVAIGLCVYISGVIPESRYFPAAWYENNIFNWVYGMYCSNTVGYMYVRRILHARQPFPHSDYRHGVRCLSGSCKSSLLFPEELKTNAEFYERGCGLVDLATLNQDLSEGCTGVVVVPVPVLADNYAYFILSFLTRKCAVVDPADPELVLYMLNVIRHLTKVEFVLTDILTTHKHWDHAGGNLELMQLSKNNNNNNNNNANSTNLLDDKLKIYGSRVDNPHACTDLVEDGDVVTVADGGVTVAVFSSPGHTRGSVVFLVGDALAKSETSQRLALFTGDCIFCGGCGAMFEVKTVNEVIQTYDLFHSDKIRTHPVTKKILSPDDVLVYVGHEYTERLVGEMIKLHTSNVNEEEVDLEMLQFRNALRAAVRSTRILRSTRRPDDIKEHVPLKDTTGDDSWSLPACTIPTTLAIEKRMNPLLTIKRSVLEEFEENHSWSNKLQTIIYTSSERHIID